MDTLLNHKVSTEKNVYTRYRGRLAPTPSGKMHLGHAQTFWIAQKRAKMFSDGVLVLRVEDLDIVRCKPHYLAQIIEDLNWFGIEWNMGPGAKPIQNGTTIIEDFGPYEQSKRSNLYLTAWKVLYDKGYIYPSPHSRRDVAKALSAPHEGDAEVIFPISLRCEPQDVPVGLTAPGAINWRFRVTCNERITFEDVHYGTKSYTAGVDFGDFVIWRCDGMASYELAVVVDDSAMNITEVVRGEDLLLSTARQLLLYRALDLQPPFFYHCPLVRDLDGRRLAKRDMKEDSFRSQGWTAERIRSEILKLDNVLEHNNAIPTNSI
eukprot:gene10540-21979_t